jgi:hypothetical protein
MVRLIVTHLRILCLVGLMRFLISIILYVLIGRDLFLNSTCLKFRLVCTGILCWNIRIVKDWQIRLFFAITCLVITITFLDLCGYSKMLGLTSGWIEEPIVKFDNGIDFHGHYMINNSILNFKLLILVNTFRDLHDLWISQKVELKVVFILMLELLTVVQLPIHLFRR